MFRRGNHGPSEADRHKAKMEASLSSATASVKRNIVNEKLNAKVSTAADRGSTSDYSFEERMFRQHEIDRIDDDGGGFQPAQFVSGQRKAKTVQEVIAF